KWLEGLNLDGPVAAIIREAARRPGGILAEPIAAVTDIRTAKGRTRQAKPGVPAFAGTQTLGTISLPAHGRTYDALIWMRGRKRWRSGSAWASGVSMSRR